MQGVLAISGGVDSMVMLDMLASISTSSTQSSQDRDLTSVETCNDPDYVVAHFDHGTRPSTKDDAIFVCKKATDYQKLFFTECGKLGEDISEDAARTARYQFLHKVAQENNYPVIYTAHHLDDLVETIAINLLRGTGWRGLAVLDASGVARPFLEAKFLPDTLKKLVPLEKKDILKYAAEHKIHFRQDPTNTSSNYLRNRLRTKLQDFTHKRELYRLWQQQKKLKAEIDEIVQDLLPKAEQPWQRGWFRDLDAKVALELLRAGTLRVGISATRPQLENFRQAILTYPSGKSFNLPQDNLVKFSKTEFYL